MAGPYQDFTISDTDQDGNAFSVSFEILNITSPEDATGAGNKRRTIQYQISFADFGDAQLALLGWPQISSGPSGAYYLSRHIPHSYTDPSGAVVPHAAVTLIDQQKGFQFKAISDSSGRYVFTSIPPGVYSASAEPQGFEKPYAPAFS